MSLTDRKTWSSMANPCSAGCAAIASAAEPPIQGESRVRGTSPVPTWSGRIQLRRHLRVHSAVDDAVALELAELLDQHLLRHARNSFLQFGETQGAASEEMEHHHHLPAPLQHAERPLDAARRHVGGDVSQLTCR